MPFWISNYIVVLSQCQITLEIHFLTTASINWYATHTLYVKMAAFTYTNQFCHCPHFCSSCVFPSTILDVLGTSLRSITLITEEGCLFKPPAWAVHICDLVKFRRNVQVSHKHTHTHMWNPVKLGPERENTWGSSKSKVVSCRSQVTNLTADRDLRARLQGNQSK